MGLHHIRSFFEIFDLEHIETFTRKVASPNLGLFCMEAKFWGMIPCAISGSYIVFTLELFYSKEKRRFGERL
jgi:hypothetical protein